MTEKVEMTAEERQEFEEFRAAREKKRREEEKKAQRETYSKMVDDEVAAALEQLIRLSDEIKTVKDTVYGNFSAILDMKSELLGLVKDNQRSHTFTTSDSQFRLTLGVNVIDGYRDTVEDGITMVKQYIESLANDERTRALVQAVLRLLSRDQTGNIKASRVLQLRKMAEDSKDEQFLEGVQIIIDSYQPTVSKRYIRAERRNDKGAWVSVPLSMTDAE